jgi:hypothetical protein
MDRKRSPQPVACDREEHSVVPRIGEQQDHATHCAVAPLERDSPLEGLHVAHVRLSFDPDAYTWAVDAGVPCSMVDPSGRRQLHDRHFLAPLEVRVDASPEPGQERELARIAHRWAGRERPRRQLKADRLE